MDALRIARRCLLLSLAGYVLALLLGRLREDWVETWFPIAMVAVCGITLSAAACIVLQIRNALRRSPVRAPKS